MLLTQIIWTCFGWIFHWDDPPIQRGQKPLALDDDMTPPTPVASAATASTALFWEAYGAAKQTLKTGSQEPAT